MHKTTRVFAWVLFVRSVRKERNLVPYFVEARAIFSTLPCHLTYSECVCGKLSLPATLINLNFSHKYPLFMTPSHSTEQQIRGDKNWFRDRREWAADRRVPKEGAAYLFDQLLLITLSSRWWLERPKKRLFWIHDVINGILWVLILCCSFRFKWGG